MVVTRQHPQKKKKKMHRYEANVQYVHARLISILKAPLSKLVKRCVSDALEKTTLLTDTQAVELTD